MRARTIDLGVRLVAACLVLVAACDDDYPRYRVDQSACRSVSSSYRWERDPISFDVYAGAPGQPDLCIHGMFSREWGRFLEGRVLDARLDDRPVDFRVFASDDVPLRLPNVARYLTAGRHSVSATVAGRFRAVSDVCDWRGCPSDDYDSTETRRVLIDAGWPLRFDQALQSVLAVPGHAQIVVEEKRDIFGIYDLESGDILTEAPAAVTVPAAYGFAIRPDDEYVVWWNGEQWLVRPIPARAAVLGLDGHGRVLSRRDGKLWIGNDRALAVALQPGAIAYPLKAGWMLGMPLSSTATTADLIELAPDGATRSIELTLGRSGLSDGHSTCMVDGTIGRWSSQADEFFAAHRINLKPTPMRKRRSNWGQPVGRPNGVWWVRGRVGCRCGEVNHWPAGTWLRATMTIMIRARRACPASVGFTIRGRVGRRMTSSIPTCLCRSGAWRGRRRWRSQTPTANHENSRRQPGS